MEYNQNNWNTNNSSGSYSAQDGYNNDRQPDRRPHKGVTLTQMIACLLVMAVLSSGLTALLLKGGNTTSQAESTTTTQDNTIVVDESKSNTEDSTQSQPADTARPSENLQVSSATTLTPAITSSVIQNSMSSVVGIYLSATTINYTGASEEEDLGSGSGVIITSDGYIVTNNHVVEGGQNIRVCLQDGSEYEATLIGTDSYSDLAVIKIDATGLPAATLGASSNMTVGDPVFAIGNPLGVLSSSVSQGIISGLDRTINVDGHNMTLMQTDAAVNPGNSGGGLFNANGELIGIVNAKSYGLDVEGIGFAIPMDTAKSIIMDLIDLGYVTGRPYLGISMQDVALRFGSGYSSNPFFSFGGNYVTGVQVVAVEEGSPAQNAGLQVNDVIVGLNDQEITGTSQLSALLYEYKVGDTVTISVLRGNETQQLSVTLGSRES
ncbi:MAG TPA: trypsin-like peptidase domain-containing protein [Candidatus Pelethousia gallinarum]|nr:trypsin-like peptidase domain-containing protein [Candidatus Pelethousia gallinarum]